MKKIALVCILLCIVACGRKESLRRGEKDPVADEGFSSWAGEVRVLSDSLEKPEKIPFTTLSMDAVKESFSKKEISEDLILGFDPREEILYQDRSDPSLETFQKIGITHEKTGESREIDLDRSYKYIDAMRAENGCLYFIGSNTDAGVDYVEVHPGGEVKRKELSSFSRIAAFADQEGFYVNLEKTLSQNRIENSLFYIEYGGDKGRELMKESFTVAEDGRVKEGHLFSNFYGMGDTAGFQELGDYSENVTEAEGSYLWDRKENVLYKIPFITKLSAYLAGNRDLIINLRAFQPMGDVEEDRCILYKKEDRGYKPYVLPDYEHSNFIRETRILKDGRIFIHEDFSIDFVDLGERKGERISLKEENRNAFSFSRDGYLSFVEKEGERNYLYWGRMENRE
ncbi:MAG: hypothetical protein SOW18_05375 [Peptoniphilus sp.]|nr:hypothetical protein [Peptoniphilus sp.]MDY3118949.1 hypothetical protein [Peptoniphilus sp.]